MLNIEAVNHIGIRIRDKDVSVLFYQALGFGKDVKTAFDLGCVQIDLENLSEQDTPKLLAKRHKPQEMVLFRATT